MTDTRNPEHIWAYDDGAHVLAFDFETNIGGSVEYIRADIAAAEKAQLKADLAKVEKERDEALAFRTCGCSYDNPDDLCLGHNVLVDRLVEARLAQGEPDRERIREIMAEEAANGAACWWRSCTGCHETNEGYSVGTYPRSQIFECEVGSGCGECGGLGVVWEYWPKGALDEMSRETVPPAPSAERAGLVRIKEIIETARTPRGGNRLPIIQAIMDEVFSALEPHPLNTSSVVHQETGNVGDKHG